jgi:erythronate-4-phosphate dehydrogenase
MLKGKVVIENHIPFIKGLLESLAPVVYLPADGITPQAVKDACALFVRTRTRCDAQLLNGSLVQFIGSPTIGTDHIDLDYCADNGIEVASAPGCNAPAVAQWVLASIALWLEKEQMKPHEVTLGVVGVGHVGSIVARWAEQCGMQVLRNDPPRALAEGSDGFACIEELQERCHIITFHTPLTREGEFPTWHLCNEQFLSNAHKCRLVLNAARGAVADTQALLDWHGELALDCWESEPHIHPALLHKAFIATPHIAGYSIEGKMRGTSMVIDRFNQHFNCHIKASTPLAPATGATCVTLHDILDSYNPIADTLALKSNPESFESLRNTYALRHEFTNL